MTFYQKLQKLPKIYYILGFLVLLVLSGYWFFGRNAHVDENVANFTKIEKREIINRQLIAGKLSGIKEVNIKSELGGIISDIYIEVGQNINRGQPIAKIKFLPDPRTNQEANRQIQIANAQFERILAQFNRNKALFQKGIISKQEYEISLQEFEIANTDKINAQKNLKISREGFSSANDAVSNVIYSTIDGVVLDLPVKIGGSVINRNTFNEGTTIATIADMSQILFKGQVAEGDLPYLSISQKLEIEINALKATKFDAHISRISPKGVDVSGITKFDIEAILVLSSEQLNRIKSGFTASAAFELERTPNVWSLEEKYITYDEDNQAFVYIQKNNKAFKQKVQVAVSNGIYTEIKAGLKPEDKIYTTPQKIEE
ncbi:MAG: efflux RND transporter periplasmic adaptor subunit [Chitinophagales bacterium]|jgi:HlyD family secretion protein|nr:efflux RND transporter periplasmic adaptor subunit [Chitinophagales bacterium]